MDSVMQFAINKLGFQVENIVVMGWSIGGYTSTWLAMNYPEIKGLVSISITLSFNRSFSFPMSQKINQTFYRIPLNETK